MDVSDGHEQPHQELVKCVVVGDTAVGKTRLICARACNKQVSLDQLLTTHVPTVWAIDQYRIYKDVLERSWEVVDGVNVSLRLWDTFGDHEKDRRFAYGRSDVVLLCFSITNPVSLRNCKLMWYPEIRRFCPQTPVLLVGCKNDLRYMYRDETYLSYFRDRSPFVRATRKSDLVMPDEARSVARELGLYYYETSVFTYYGVNEVFENAIRAALIARRQQRFWQTNLKRVQRPLLQAPFLPPKPMPPEVIVAPSMYQENMTSLWLNQMHTDLVLVAGPVGFPVHRFILAASSNAFHRLLTMELIPEIRARSSSESSLVSNFGEATVGAFNDDTELLIRSDQNNSSKIWEQLKRRSCCQVPSPMSSDSLKVAAMSTTVSTGVNHRELNHPAFQSIQVSHCDGLQSANTQTVVTLTKFITPQAMHQCLKFVYTGTIDTRIYDIQQEMRQAAEFLELPQITVLLSNIQKNPQLLNNNGAETIHQQFSAGMRQRLNELCLEQGLFADVIFELDDGAYPAHKPMLVARCDMMKAMFRGDFRESQARVVVFPGVKEYTFHKLLCYLYTDEVPEIAAAKCFNLLELANRLCLPRLVNLVECRVIEDLSRLAQSDTNEAIEHCLRLLEPVKLHNAHQLADWCMNHLCINYNKLCKMSPRSVRLLHPENQEYLNEHRWPPVWYLKDYDYYQRCLAQRDKESKPALRNGRNHGTVTGGGCLCFCGSKSRRNGGAAGGSGAGGELSVSSPDVSSSIYNEMAAIATAHSQDDNRL